MKKSTPNIKLRPATIDDLSLLKHWDEQPHVIESDPNDDWKWETELLLHPDWQEHLIAELDDSPIGFIEIIDPAKEELHYWGDVPDNLRAIDIWIGEKENLGKGYGTQIMHLAIDRCFKNKNVTAIIIDPLDTNVDAHRFYERLGFQFVEHRKFSDDCCSIFQLDRKHWNELKDKNDK